MCHKSVENLVGEINFFALLLVFLFIGNFSLFTTIPIFVLSIIYLNCITKMLSFVLLYFLTYIDYITNVLTFKFDQYLECVSLKRVHIICNSKTVFWMSNFRCARLFIIQLIDILNDRCAGPYTKRLDLMIIAHLLILISDKIVISMNMWDC